VLLTVEGSSAKKVSTPLIKNEVEEIRLAVGSGDSSSLKLKLIV
jgi:hypothetical protein